jgi:exodeoxyribonuclease VII large subunit
MQVMRSFDRATERLRERLVRTDRTLRARDARLRGRMLGLSERRGRIEQLTRRARSGLARRVERLGSRLQSATASLRALDPTRVIERGYALVWHHDDQRLVRSVDEVRPEEGIYVSVADGEIDARVIGIVTESSEDV